MSGRAKRIQDIMSRAESLSQSSSGQSQFPPTASSGRASRLLQFRENISGFPEGRGNETSAKIARGDSSFFSSSGSHHHETPSFEKVAPNVNVPLEYRGKRGTPVEGTANYIRLEHHSNKPVCEYEIVFTPFIESKKLRAKILHSFKEEIGIVYIYNGTNLFVPNPLKMALFTLETINPTTSQPISIRIELRRYRKLSECVFIFNLLFRKIMHLLDMKRINRSNFDPKSPQMIPQHNLEIWPGYVTAVDEFNGGLLLCLDCCFKVLNTQTVLELIKSIRFAQTHDFQRLSAKLLIGQSVLTRYNNRNYVVEDILWNKTPKDTFTLADGRVISYIQYYREHYNIDIRETSQPLLLNRQTKISPQTSSVSDQIVVIVPELCYLTGLREEMRTDMRVMKDVANFTRLTPNQRMNTLRNFIRKVNQHPECLRLLADWNLKLQNATIDISLRVLDPETIYFGSGAMHYGTAEADWTMACGKSRVFDARDIMNWVILYSNKDRSVFEQFADTYLRQSQFLGIKVNRPMPVALFDDRTDTYVSKIKEALQNSCQAIVVICPSQREDRYAAIKKVCCVDIPVPSQVVQVRTLTNPKRHRSVVQKIIMQVNCKLGGSLWAVKIPFKNWMICGIDIYHTKDISGQSVAAFVSTTHDSCTRWYSTVAMNNRSEITNGLTSCFERALKEYQKENNFYPSYVVIYRDGVGDGQISACIQYEIPQLQRCIETVMKDPSHNGQPIDLCYVVVQKRINTRFFSCNREGYTNPPPGTVLDHEVTRRNYNDFFLVSQHVRQGTINPVHYIIAHDSKNTDPDRIQLLTFKMCHLYYNWTGTIRVPAPCQYAHKMAYLIGQNIRKVPAPELSNRLFYL